jgi:hypothetical protein
MQYRKYFGPDQVIYFTPSQSENFQFSMNVDWQNALTLAAKQSVDLKEWSITSYMASTSKVGGQQFECFQFQPRENI